MRSFATRLSHPAVLLLLVAGLFPFRLAAAELPADDADGWYSWTIDSASATTIYVRVDSGKLIEFRSGRFNCGSVPESHVTALGLVSPQDNFHWFRQFVEDSDNSRHVRQGALFGVAQSDSDEAFHYLERLLGI